MEEQGRGVCVRQKGKKEKGGVLPPLWARGKSNKMELMGVWSFRAQREGFAHMHWWVRGDGDGKDGFKTTECLAKQKRKTPGLTADGETMSG